jgi:hypothetical protein
MRRCTQNMAQKMKAKVKIHRLNWSGFHAWHASTKETLTDRVRTITAIQFADFADDAADTMR